MNEKEFQDQMEYTAYLNARDADCGWQPIETAPLGKAVIVRCTIPGFMGRHTVLARFYKRYTLPVADPYVGEDWCDVGPDGDSYMPAGWYEATHSEEAEAVNLEPTHWMPLPPPPEG